MNLATWKSNKSPIMQEIRLLLKKTAEKGQPTLSNKESKRSWREEILGILSEDQKKQIKTERQRKNKIKKQFDQDEDNQ
jgi:hypothetical protein